jgi:putative two-component system response regulator
MAASIALSHHEKWDGSGYPHGLAGPSIPIEARMVAVADVFDALTMKRPYKLAWSMDRAIQFIRDGSGKHFDPALVEVFLSTATGIEKIRAYWDAQEMPVQLAAGMPECDEHSNTRHL